MDTPIDVLQIKIERAKDNLPKETKKAIDSVDWRAFILSLREKKGFSFEQLEDLELETELLLCGLVPPEDYPKEIEKRLGISKSQVDLLINEINEGIFHKIREELVKNTERQELFIKKEGENNYQLPITNYELKDKEEPIKNNQLRITNEESKSNDELPITSYELKSNEKKENESIPFQKLSGSFQIPTIKTEYSLNKFTKEEDRTKIIPPTDKMKTSRIDPYRIDPSE